MDNLIERRRLNDEIERTFVMASLLAGDIEVFDKTDRNYTILTLYEKFYHAFGLLVRLTSVYPQMRKSEAAITDARTWLKGKFDITNDDKLLLQCMAGVIEFDKYSAVLADQGVMVPPVRG
jgi:hypothetical protein